MTSIKTLPKLYKNEMINIKSNNKNICYIERKDIIKNNSNNSNIRETINEIFNGIGHPYNIRVYLETKNFSKETSLLAKNSEFIITTDKEKIPIDNIIKIERLSKK